MIGLWPPDWHAGHVAGWGRVDGEGWMGKADLSGLAGLVCVLLKGSFVQSPSATQGPVCADPLISHRIFT